MTGYGSHTPSIPSSQGLSLHFSTNMSFLLLLYWGNGRNISKLEVNDFILITQKGQAFRPSAPLCFLIQLLFPDDKSLSFLVPPGLP